jgi:hypothetical protein
MSLQDDLKLDILDLDTAILEQPALFEKVGREWAEAVSERDHAKDQLAMIKANVDNEIRQDPDAFGVSGKPTETWIANQVMLHPEVIAANIIYSEAINSVNVLAIGKEALDHRLASLKILTELYKGNYFSASSRTHSPHEMALEISKEKQRESMENHPRMLKRIRKEE